MLCLEITFTAQYLVNTYSQKEASSCFIYTHMYSTWTVCVQYAYIFTSAVVLIALQCVYHQIPVLLQDPVASSQCLFGLKKLIYFQKLTQILGNTREAMMSNTWLQLNSSFLCLVPGDSPVIDRCVTPQRPVCSSQWRSELWDTEVNTGSRLCISCAASGCLLFHWKAHSPSLSSSVRVLFLCLSQLRQCCMF